MARLGHAAGAAYKGAASLEPSHTATTAVPDVGEPGHIASLVERVACVEKSIAAQQRSFGAHLESLDSRVAELGRELLLFVEESLQELASDMKHVREQQTDVGRLARSLGAELAALKTDVAAKLCEACSSGVDGEIASTPEKQNGHAAGHAHAKRTARFPNRQGSKPRERPGPKQNYGAAHERQRSSWQDTRLDRIVPEMMQSPSRGRNSFGSLSREPSLGVPEPGQNNQTQSPSQKRDGAAGAFSREPSLGVSDSCVAGLSADVHAVSGSGGATGTSIVVESPGKDDCVHFCEGEEACVTHGVPGARESHDLMSVAKRPPALRQQRDPIRTPPRPTLVKMSPSIQARAMAFGGVGESASSTLTSRSCA